MLRIGPEFSSSSYTQPLQKPAAPRNNVAFGQKSKMFVISVEAASKIADDAGIGNTHLVGPFFVDLKRVNDKLRRGVEAGRAELDRLIRNEEIANGREGNDSLKALERLRKRYFRR